MTTTQTLLPNLRLTVFIVIASIALATVGLFQRRSHFVLKDGTIVVGTLDHETDTTLFVERPSGSILQVPRDRLDHEEWFHVEVDLALGLDLKGGTALRYRVPLDNVKPEEREKTMEGTIETFKNRLDALGVKEISTVRHGQDEIAIELPGVSMVESESYEKVIQSLGRLEFRLVADSKAGVVNESEEREKVRKYLDGLTKEGRVWTPKGVDLSQFDIKQPGGGVYRWLPYSQKTIDERPEAYRAFPFVLIEFDPAIQFSGEDIERVYPSPDQYGHTGLGFEIKSSRAAAFGEFTGGHLGRQMAILLDNEVSSHPELHGRISDHGIIEGGLNGFKPDELKNLQTVLRSGSLRVTPEKLSKATIGPTLGEASIRTGVIAGLWASILVLGFICVYYQASGIISCLTLLLGIYLLVGGMGFLQATLTLPGIAGIVLTIGMAVDQNILINERVREEREKGKTLAQAVKNGFDRAFVTIFDAQATTFLAGAIMYWKGSGPIRGFAVTLMLGILTTMFAAIAGSKVLFAIGLARDWFKTLKMMKIIGVGSVQYTKLFKSCLIGSIVVVGSGVFLFFHDIDDLKGLDFAGGFSAHVRLREPTPQAEVFNLVTAKYPGAEVVTMKDIEGGESSTAAGSRDYLIKIAAKAGAAAANPDAERDRYVDQLRAALHDKLLPDGLTTPTVTKDEAAQRWIADFDANFALPIDQSVVEGRLRDQMTVQSVAPNGGASPTTSYHVRAAYNSEVTADRVEGEATASLTNLPGKNRLSEPMPESEFIGGKVGKKLTNDAIIALLLSLVGILVYVRLRFREFWWGMAGVIALFHDVMFCMGAAALAHRLGIVNVELDLTMVGAFLTIVGYSINDTIVIYDRVRENIPRMPGRPLSEVVDVSLNQTMSRTILTSFTVFMALLVLFIMNYGQRNVLEGFSFVMLMGVITGTYSTVFIASPIIVWFDKWEKQKHARRTGAPGAPAVA